MKKTRIEHVTVLTMDAERHIYQDGYVEFEDGVITGVGAQKDAPISETESFEVVDGRGGILMPGMVNTHCHMAMIPFRSMGDDCNDRLRRFLFPLELEAMTPQLVYLATRYAAAELLLSGVTSTLDMYYFEDQAARACEEMGIRAWVGETVIDMETCDSKEKGGGFEIARQLLKDWGGHPRIHPFVAPHATNTVSPKLLQKAHELAAEYGSLYSLHVSEMDYEMTYFRDTYGKTPVEFLDHLGVLDERTVAAHCIHLNQTDVELFAKRGAKVAHCIGANTKAGKGICPLTDLDNAGVIAGLGTDGPASGNTLELFTLMRMTCCGQKTRYHARSLFPSDKAVELATIGGARVFGAEQEIGSIEIGKAADLVLVETESVNMFPIYNHYSALVYSAGAANVDKVWVDGTLLVSGHRLTSYALPELRARLSEAMPAFRKAAAKYPDCL